MVQVLSWVVEDKSWTSVGLTIVGYTLLVIELFVGVAFVSLLLSAGAWISSSHDFLGF